VRKICEHEIVTGENKCSVRSSPFNNCYVNVVAKFQNSSNLKGRTVALHSQTQNLNLVQCTKQHCSQAFIKMVTR